MTNAESLVRFVQAYKPDATVDDIKRELPYCLRKLNFIIQREGDGEGRRRETRYLAQLIAEQIRANQYAYQFAAISAKKGAHRSVPQNRNSILTKNY